MVVCVICGAITGVAGSLWWVLGPGATAVAVFEWLSRPAGLWTLALGTVLLAAGVMYGAHRRWLRWELAA
jgi:hypothetical protein